MAWLLLLGCGEEEQAPPLDTSMDDTEPDSDTEAEDDSADTGLARIEWYWELHATDGGGYQQLWMTRDGRSGACTFLWEHAGVQPLTDCEACTFGWEYTGSATEAATASWCEGSAQHHVDYAATFHFAEVWTDPSSGQAYEDVVLHYFGEPYFAWYAVSYVDGYEDGVVWIGPSKGYYYE